MNSQFDAILNFNGFVLKWPFGSEAVEFEDNQKIDAFSLVGMSTKDYYFFANENEQISLSFTDDTVNETNDEYLGNYNLTLTLVDETLTPTLTKNGETVTTTGDLSTGLIYGNFKITINTQEEGEYDFTVVKSLASGKYKKAIFGARDGSGDFENLRISCGSVNTVDFPECGQSVFIYGEFDQSMFTYDESYTNFEILKCELRKYSLFLKKVDEA